MKKSLLALLFFAFASVSFAQNYTIQQYLNIKSASGPTFSPDSRQMAYLTNVTGTTQVWVIDLPNGTPRGVPLNRDAVAVPADERGKHAVYCFITVGSPFAGS